jgi:hypothetical protein
VLNSSYIFSLIVCNMILDCFIHWIISAHENRGGAEIAFNCIQFTCGAGFISFEQNQVVLIAAAQFESSCWISPPRKTMGCKRRVSEKIVISNSTRPAYMNSPQYKRKFFEPQTTGENVCQKKVRVGTGQYFKWMEGFTT